MSFLRSEQSVSATSLLTKLDLKGFEFASSVVLRAWTIRVPECVHRWLGTLDVVVYSDLLLVEVELLHLSLCGHGS